MHKPKLQKSTHIPTTVMPQPPTSKLCVSNNLVFLIDIIKIYLIYVITDCFNLFYILGFFKKKTTTTKALVSILNKLSN